MDKLKLMKITNEVRKDIVTAVHSAKAGHPGGSLSAAEILTYLYFEEMDIDPKDPGREDRDRFVLSKGHTAPALYSVLAERGYFPKEDLVTLRPYRFLSPGTPGYETDPGRGHVFRFAWPGYFRSSGYGNRSKAFRRVLPCLYDARRRRDPGGTGLGSFHACRTPQTGQSGRDRGQQ